MTNKTLAMCLASMPVAWLGAPSVLGAQWNVLAGSNVPHQVAASNCPLASALLLQEGSVTSPTSGCPAACPSSSPQHAWLDDALSNLLLILALPGLLKTHKADSHASTGKLALDTF